MNSEAPARMLRWAYLPESESPANGWLVKRFTEVAQVIAGQSPPSETYNEKGDGLPFLQGNANFSFKYPRPTLWCRVPSKVAELGDTLISVRAPVGEVNRADRDYAIGRGLAAVRAADADGDFLYHGLQRWRWCLQRVAQGTTFDAVTARHFSQLFVAVPSDADEQIAIARTLDVLDTLIQKVREAVNRARDVKHAFVQRFFCAALGETAYADRPAKELPEGWDLVPMETLLAAEPKNGASPKASSSPPGTPTFSIAAVREGRIDLDRPENLKFALVSPKVIEKFRVSQGDVLIVRGNANPDLVGKAGMVDRFPEDCIYPDITKRVIFRCEGKHTVTPDFAVLTWNHSIVHNQVLRRAKTSNGTLKINSRDVKQIIMPVPTRAEQSMIVDLAKAVDAKIDSLNAILAAHEQLRRSLMHDLLTGKVRIPSSVIQEMVKS